MYKLADYFDVPSLRTLAMKKLSASARKLWQLLGNQSVSEYTEEEAYAIRKFTDAAHVAYGWTFADENSIRSVVVTATLEYVHQLMELDEFRSLLRVTIPQFGIDLLFKIYEQSKREVHRQTPQVCVVCGNVDTLRGTCILVRSCGKCGWRLEQ